jgi:transcriptional regulator with XRE-family HTH domain
MQSLLFSKNLKYLRENKGLKQHEMLTAIGFKQSTWNGYETGKSFPNFKDLIKLSHYFGIPETDLIHNDLVKVGVKEGISGNGTKVNEADSLDKQAISYDKQATVVTHSVTPAVTPPQKNSKKEGNFKDQISTLYNLGAPKVVTVNERKEENIIYVPVKARAGYLAGYGDPEYIQSLPSFRLPGLTNATYRMFETEGPSMAPNIISGDRLIGQWVNSLDEIRDNRVYVMVCRDGVVVKRVLNRITERGRMVFKSDTITHRKDYPTYEVDPTDVLEVWYVRLKLSSDLSEPAEVYHRIGDLEADMVEVKQFLSTIKKQLPGK